MVKLTPELIESVPSHINTVKERQLDLRGEPLSFIAQQPSPNIAGTGYTIPAIENLGITKVCVS